MQKGDILRDLVEKARDPKTSPDKLVEVIQELAARTFFCGEEEAKAHAAWQEAERQRKYRYAEERLKAMSEGASGTKADSMAEVATEEERKAEIAAFANRANLKAMLDGSRDVLDALRTRISYLKWERTNTNTQT